jgi:hypothetical protein
MMVWMPTDESSFYPNRPHPAPTGASFGQCAFAGLQVALTDSTNRFTHDQPRPYYHWWPKNKSWECVQYDFEKEETISSSKVYWFDDGPWGGCRIPADWKLEYKQGEKWVPVKAKTAYKVSKDAWDEIQFEPVTTKAIRMYVRLPQEHSTGIHEWAIQ